MKHFFALLVMFSLHALHEPPKRPMPKPPPEPMPIPIPQPPPLESV